MKKNIRVGGMMWSAVLLFVAILVGVAVQSELKAQDCNSAESLATMSRQQAEVCFSWDFD